MPIMRQIIVEHGSVILDIDGDTLTGTMVNKDQIRRDLFSIVKRGALERRMAIAEPWQPEHDLTQISEFVVAWDKDKLGEQPEGWQASDSAAGSMIVEAQDSDNRRAASVTASDEAFIAVYDAFKDGFGELESRLEIPAGCASAVGLVFGYQDDANYYVYCVNARSRTAELIRRENGQERVVTTKQVDLPLEGAVKIEVEAVEETISVQLQDELEYMIELGEELPNGRIGVYVGPGGSAHYRSFTIERKN
jgi:hypothetical protein